MFVRSLEGMLLAVGTPVEDAIEDAIADLRLELAGHKISVVIQPGLPPVEMEPDAAEGVLQLILRHAVTSAPSGSEIGVAASRWQDAVEIRVADRFSGSREARSTRADLPGDRVGQILAAAKATVLTHGGQIWVEDERGGGTTVVVRLPSSEDA